MLVSKLSRQHPFVVIMVLNLILAGLMSGFLLFAVVVVFVAVEDDLMGSAVSEELPQVLGDFVFPLPVGAGYSYVDSWGAPREFGGNRQHLGTDIMAGTGTPVLAVTQGFVERKGWDRLGGWRIGVRGDDGNYYYYAHNFGYAHGIEVGIRVRSGQMIAFVGSSGYGEIGTTGRFPPHLHFGIYDRSNQPFNPYPYLRRWENSQVMKR